MLDFHKNEFSVVGRLSHLFMCDGSLSFIIRGFVKLHTCEKLSYSNVDSFLMDRLGCENDISGKLNSKGDNEQIVA